MATQNQSGNARRTQQQDHTDETLMEAMRAGLRHAWSTRGAADESNLGAVLKTNRAEEGALIALRQVTEVALIGSAERTHREGCKC